MEGKILFIHAQTSVHPGSGSALGTIDLPVQRERHTNWPIIPGSSLKGIIRDACRNRIAINLKPVDEKSKRKQADENSEIKAVFGPPAVESSEQAGAISITDARILLFPVRSLKGVFAWITCQGVIERLQRDLKLFGETENFKIKYDKTTALVSKTNDNIVSENQIVLEEFDFPVNKSPEVTELAKWIADNVTDDEAIKESLQKKLVILPDDEFTHFVRYATQVETRIALNYETKTAVEKALFYEEFLPPETIMYSIILASEERKEAGKTAQEIIEFISTDFPSILQIGGDETIGKGFCWVKLSDGKEVAHE